MLLLKSMRVIHDLNSGERRLPTAPHRLPVLGHAVPLMRDRLRFLESLEPFGPVVKVYLGPKPAYFINDPELIHRVLVTEAGKFSKGRVHEKLSVVFGEGLAYSTGEVHLLRRRIIAPAFRRERVSDYIPIMSRLAEAQADAWQPERPIAVDVEMRNLALAVIAQTLFSSDLGRDAAAEFERSVPILTEGAVSRAVSPRLLEKMPTPGNRRFDQAVTRVRAIVENAIDAHRASASDHGDLLADLLAARDPETGGTLSDAQVRDEVITISIAGVETTAAALAWSLHEVSCHPAIEERLHAEVDAVLGLRRVDAGNLARLSYTAQVADEVLRLHPIWLTARLTTTAVELGGARIPAGADVLISPHALHRSERFFDDARHFDPGRWGSAHVREGARTAAIPFGSGSTQCPGEALARTEMIVTLAVVCARWRLRLAPGQQVTETPALAVHPSSLTMIAAPRRGCP
jgi:cytochrome P450